MPFKITIDGRCLNDHFPGIGRYLFNLLRSLPEVAEDAEIHVFTETTSTNTRFDLGALEERGIHLIPTAVPIRGIGQQLVLPKQMRQLGTQVFHAPYFITTYRAPCPMVVGLYDTIAQRYPHNLPSGKARLAAVVGMRFALRSAKTVLTLSRFAKDDLAKTLDIAPERIVVTPGAPPDGLQPATPDAIDELRERLRLPERYMLHVGTNKPHKNLERLVEAWAELQKTELAKSPSVEFGIVFAGAHDPQYPEPKAIGRRLGATGIHCLGHVAEEDLPALYSGAELFILPSLDEGFGLPILEAMACGTAVACSRRASLPEVAGHAAIYFDPESAQSITEALARVIKNPSYRKVLGDRGRIRAGQLTWKHTARLTLDAYRRAAAG